MPSNLGATVDNTRMKTLIAAATITAWLIGANVQGISSAEIAAAIEQGSAGKTLQKKCSPGGLDNGMDIVAEGPIGRIMRAARDAKRKNQDFTAADVTPLMAGAWLTVTATRVRTLHKPVSEYVTPGIPRGLDYRTSFVLKSKPPRSEQAIVLEPLGPITYDSDESFSHRVARDGGPVPANLPPLPGSNMAASFDFAAFQAIPHKDVEIVVFMTDTGEQKCKISENERKALK
jgi:hypothetical protein